MYDALVNQSIVATLPDIQKLKPEQSLLSFVGGPSTPTAFGKSLLFQLAPSVVKELAKANFGDWLWQIQSGSGQIQ